MENTTSIRPITGQDILQMWKRRRWWFLGIAAFIAAATPIVVGFWPSSYLSQALILIDQPAVSQDYVKQVVAIDTEQEIEGLVQQVLSHTLLQRLPSFKNAQNISQDDFDKLLKNVSIDVLRENSDPRRPAGKPYGLRVSFRSSGPKLAQEGANEVAALVVQQADEMTIQQASETTNVLRAQLNLAEAKVNETDKALDDFKKQYVGQLPIEEQLTIETLSRLQGQLDTNAQAMARARQTISDLQATGPTPAGTGGSTNSNTPEDPTLSRLQTDLQGLKVELASLQSRYKPNHPDVIKKQEEIRRLEAQVAEQKAETAASAAPTPSKAGKPTPQLPAASVARIDDSQAELATRQKEQGQIQQQIDHYQSNLGAIPLRAQQFTELQRDYDSARKDYETLRDQVAEAEQSMDVYQQHKGVRLRIQDFASLPNSPDEPIRWKFNLGGLAGGLFMGLLVAGVLEFRDTSFKSDRDTEFYMGLKNLALIPDFPTDPEVKQVRRARLHRIIGATVVALIFAGVNLYVYLVRL